VATVFAARPPLSLAARRERRRDDRDVRRRGECATSRPARLARCGRSRARPGWLPRWPDGWTRTVDVPAKAWAPGPHALHRSRPQERRGRRLSVGIAAHTVRSWARHAWTMPLRCCALTSTGTTSTPCSWGYAHCIDGQADVANRRIADALDPMKGSPPDTASLEPWRQRHSGRNSHSRVTRRRGGVGRIRCSRRMSVSARTVNGVNAACSHLARPKRRRTPHVHASRPVTGGGPSRDGVLATLGARQ
jgi:hypothetical protein